MKAAIVATFASLALAPAALAGTTPVGTVHAFIDAFDKGDVAGAAATQAADVSILDEMAPHAWHSFGDWAGALMADAKAHGQSGNKVTLGEVIRAQDDGDTAYVTMAATYSYSQKGAAMREPARMVFALRKTAGDWKITAWAWAGDPAKAK